MKNIDFFLQKVSPVTTIDTIDNYFHFLLITNILPFEAKYVSLYKKKNFTLVRNIVKTSIKIFKKTGEKITYKDFIEKFFMPFYDKFLLNSKKEYILDLIDKNDKIIKKHLQFDIKFKNEVRKCIQIEDKKLKEEYIEHLISIIETKLNIENELIHKSQILIPDVKIHTDSKLYDKDIKFLTQRLLEFNTFFSILEQIIQEKNPNFFINLEKENLKAIETLENIEYLYFVVIHEFLNFLAHYSMGVTFFCSPNNYKTNINKAISHLKRAIMDLLDVMIVEYNCSHTPEYLKIRTLKLASLGNKSKIENLIKELQKIFKECVCKKEEKIKKSCDLLEKI